MDLIAVPARLRPRAHKLARMTGAFWEGFVNLPALPVARLSNGAWTIIYYGSDLGREDIKALLFRDGSEMQDLGRIASAKLQRHIDEALDQEADLVVYERPGSFFPRLSHTPIAFDVPTWIDQRVTLPDDPKELLRGKSRATKRNLINRMANQGYEVTISQDPASLKHFFEHIHLPFIARRHQARARSVPYQDILRSFRKGALVGIAKDGETVAGTVCYLHKDQCFLSAYGVRQTESEEEQKALGVFLDWQCLLFAYNHGVAFANLGGSLPATSDGVFQKKKRWQAEVSERNRTYKHWTFLARDLPPALRDHLNTRGLITGHGGSYFGVNIPQNDTSLDDGEAGSKAKDMCKLGLQGLAEVVPGAPIIHHLARD